MQRVVRFFSYRAYTDSNHGDNLRYEWPLALCYHLIVCDVLLVGLVYNCYTLMMMSTTLLIYVCSCMF
jgi:hypothetical protein